MMTALEIAWTMTDPRHFQALNELIDIREASPLEALKLAEHSIVDRGASDWEWAQEDRRSLRPKPLFCC
eukprot:1858908-Pyramimonas_sp.AAC.1